MKRKYRVSVTFHAERNVDLSVWAEDESDAEDRACEIVERWENVVSGSAEADEVEEDYAT